MRFMEPVSQNFNFLTVSIQHILHIIILVKLCSDVHYMSVGKQYLELQEWEDCIKSKKATLLALIMLVPINNPPG